MPGAWFRALFSRNNCFASTDSKMAVSIIIIIIIIIESLFLSFIRSRLRSSWDSKLRPSNYCAEIARLKIISFIGSSGHLQQPYLPSHVHATPEKIASGTCSLTVRSNSRLSGFPECILGNCHVTCVSSSLQTSGGERAMPAKPEILNIRLYWKSWRLVWRSMQLAILREQDDLHPKLRFNGQESKNLMGHLKSGRRLKSKARRQSPKSSQPSPKTARWAFPK